VFILQPTITTIF